MRRKPPKGPPPREPGPFAPKKRARRTASSAPPPPPPPDDIQPRAASGTAERSPLIAPVEPGSQWRVACAVIRDDAPPETFRTTSFDRHLRHGTILVTVQSICAGGCHVVASLPDGTLMEYESAMLKPLAG